MRDLVIKKFNLCIKHLTEFSFYCLLSFSIYKQNNYIKENDIVW